MEKSYSESYAAAGVDITAGYRSVELMKQYVARTMNEHCIGGLGGFGGLFELDCTGYKHPVLISGTDGVGTKLKIAMIMDKHDTIGIDCVAMCVNDVICAGAKPLVFLDYIACGRNIPEKIAEIVKGVAEGCVQADCSLVGGETAEHPGMMPEEEYDLAGFTVGVVDKEKILSNETMVAGDVILALPSTGVHSNGFSLVRKIFDIDANPDVLHTAPAELGGKTLGEALLAPTKIYVKPVLKVLEEVDVKGISHITGGGFYENIPRSLKEGLLRPHPQGGCPHPGSVPADAEDRQYLRARYVQHLQHGRWHGAHRPRRAGRQGAGHPARKWRAGSLPSGCYCRR